jgi:hypothetical protein
MQPSGSEEWTTYSPNERPWQAAKHWYKRATEDDKWWRDRHQHKVLRHVHEQEGFAERVERR